MSSRKLILAASLLLILGAAALVEAQRNRRFRNYYDQNEPPETEFIFARWRYGTHAGRGGLAAFGRGYGGGDGWAHDYPTAEQHINQVMSEATGLNVQQMSYRIVELSDPEIFKYPFSYVSEPGEMWLTEEEVLNLREYINRGGFVMFDDFDGARQLENLRQNLLRVFPERDIFPLSVDHPIFNTFYDIDALHVTAPYTYEGNVMFYGLSDGKDDLSMIICHNNDIGDFWEWIDQPRFPLEPSAESLRLGINFIVYAMSH